MKRMPARFSSAALGFGARIADIAHIFNVPFISKYISLVRCSGILLNLFFEGVEKQSCIVGLL
jgi:hypothetical protein